MRAAHEVNGAIANPETATRQTDLAEHACESRERPIGLLAVLRTLQRPRNVKHRAVSRHFARERDNACGRDLGDGGGPCRILRLAITASQVWREALEPRGVTREEVGVVELLSIKGMCEC